LPQEFIECVRSAPIAIGAGSVSGRVAHEARVIHVLDQKTDPDFMHNELMTLSGQRSFLGVPLMRDGAVIGVITLTRPLAEAFTARQIDLVRTFADQAAIAIGNARLLAENRKRQAELRITFDNMAGGVAMFDENERLISWNRNLQEILEIDDAFLAEPRTFRDYITYLGRRGEFGDVDPEEEYRRLAAGRSAEHRIDRVRPNGRVLDVNSKPVPGGGFVALYSDVTDRRRAEDQVRLARDAAEQALAGLKAAQANLIQAEKMASLGQLTAGIAHEIKNPLNFVNNFAGLSIELLDELKDEAQEALAGLDDDRRAAVDEVMGMLTGNLQKIGEHGRRADGIVRSMLAHSRGGSGERERANLNALIEEALNLAYHGARAQDKEFNITLERDLDPAIAPIELVPQDITRVFLNLFGNGFYAARKRATAAADPSFRPLLKVMTRDVGDTVEVRIRDNGIGIPAEVKERLFQPFFTTKPTGEGTGLGLSISYEIVTRQHGGAIEVDSDVGAYTEFLVRLPRTFGGPEKVDSSGVEARA